MQDPGGVATLVKAELKCACYPNLCGSLDGGTDAGAVDAGADASVLGTGACAASCDTMAQPDPTCLRCLSEATGTQANPQHCFASVSAACQADPSCIAYVMCVGTCK
jgi:hypothetical protein